MAIELTSDDLREIAQPARDQSARLGGLEKSNTFEAGMTAISKIKEQRAGYFEHLERLTYR